MQKLVKAAKEGTKDGLEKTKAAVKKGRSFIKTKSFCQGVEKYTFDKECSTCCFKGGFFSFSKML